MQDSAGPLRAVEVVTRDCEPGVRMHRVEDAGGLRAQARSQLLRSEGLTATTKNSSDLGFGRKSMPSVGVAEALSGAAYGGMRAAKPEDYAATMGRGAQGSSSAGSSSSGSWGADPPVHLIKSGVFNRGVWDVVGGVAAGNEAEQQHRSLLATTQAPNRVFDTLTPAIIATAVPDPYVRAQRERWLG
jgi:hypothetical protein